MRTQTRSNDANEKKARRIGKVGLWVGLIAGAGMAATTAAHAGAGRWKHGGEHGIVEQMAKVLEQVDLSEDQKAELDSLRERARAAHDAARERMQASRDEIDAALEQPVPDLRQLAGLMESNRAAGQAARREIRDGFLALYDGLNDAQKAEVGTALREKRDAWRAKKEAWREKRAAGETGRGHHDGACACADGGCEHHCSEASGDGAKSCKKGPAQASSEEASPSSEAPSEG